MRRVRFLITIVIIALLTGCNSATVSLKYVVHFSKSVRIPKEKPLLVVCNNPSLRLAVENILVDKKLYLKDFDSFKKDFTTLIGEYRDNAKTETHVDNYNILESLNKNLQKSGELTVSPQFFKELSAWNDLKDEKIRVEDYKNVEITKFDAMHELYNKLDVEYLLVVEQLEGKDSFKFQSKLVSVDNNKILFTFYYEVDSETIMNTNYQKYENSQVSEYSKLQIQAIYLRFADNLSKRMLGGFDL
jgi:hypothetical protein